MSAPALKVTNELAVMDGSGDSKTIWDVDNEDEIAVAREMFRSLKKKKYIAYNVKKNGKPGNIIHEFDKTLGKIIMIPPVVGG